MMYFGFWRIVALACISGTFATSSVLAQPNQENNPLSFDRNIQGLLNRYCYRCHNDDKSSGGVDLKSDTDPRMIAANSLKWQTALDLLVSGEMPPEKAKQPTDEERQWIVEFIESTVTDFDCSAPRDPGPPTLRRLNRIEYDHSIEYLTGLKLELSADFPEDTISFGFRNIAQSLTMSPLHVDQYYTAARKVVEQVLAGSGQPAGTATGTPGYAFHRVFFIDSKVVGTEAEAANAVIARFANRAFRRDIDEAMMEKWMTLYAKAREKGETYQDSVGHVLTSILISPRFLMRTEVQKPDADGPYAVDDFDLASRLSFFLWSSPPDDELLELARRGTLHRDDVIKSQVRRMLSDPRGISLVDQFFAPWLQIDSLDSHRPDPKAFPQWSDNLRESIVQEPRELLSYMVRDDRSITELIDAPYVLVNRTLVEHYGLTATDGSNAGEFQKLSLSDRRRGGVLTTAAVLMSQSDPGRTNVPRRGNFIAAAILGTAPPPPPADVPPLVEEGELAATLTLRERFEAHRADPQCSSCHSKIDPLGFALENYDGIGKWRDQEVGKPIDASGELPDGRRFNGPIEMKDILLENKAGLARVMTRQLLIYALGRGPILGDDCVIDDVVTEAAKNEYRFSEFVIGIVHSFPFRNTRSPDY